MKLFVGKTIQAVTVNVLDDEYVEAKTDNYFKLRIAGKHEANQWIEARVEEVAVGRVQQTANLGMVQPVSRDN